VGNCPYLSKEIKMKVQVKIRSMSTSQGIAKNGDVVDLPEEEIKKIIVMRPNAFEILQAEEAATEKSEKPTKKKRARNADGTLKGDDPSTPDVNEAYEDG
tara:strand:+ start:218 stop:517 length:300 start_codon:yes stop_codon:yes gene_type:complete